MRIAILKTQGASHSPNMGLEVSATPTPKSPTATSPNPNIKLNSQVLLQARQSEQ